MCDYCGGMKKLAKLSTGGIRKIKGVVTLWNQRTCMLSL